MRWLAPNGCGRARRTPRAYAPDPRPAQTLDFDKPRSAKSGIGHDDHFDPRWHPFVQPLEQRALRASIAQLRFWIDLLIDRQPPPHAHVRGCCTQLHEQSIGSDRRPIDRNHQRLPAAAQRAQQRCSNHLGFLTDTSVAHQSIHSLERRLVSALTHQPTGQPRQTQQVSAHHSTHRRAQQFASCRVDQTQAFVNKALYNLSRVRVHDRSPCWLVPTQRKNRSCTRRFSSPYIQSLDLYRL